MAATADLRCGMAELRVFDRNAELSEVVAAVRTDGAAILHDVVDEDVIRTLRDELAPWVERTPAGRDSFSGLQTSRTGALVARSRTARALVMHPSIIELANTFLAPFTNRIQLHLTQIIRIMPGQGSQPLHRDRLAWGGYLPRTVEPQFNTIWALTDFTAENGATRVVPGSSSWEDDRRALPDEITRAVMPAGSVLLYSGSVIHSGGENQSDTDRWGMNITYALGWLRTEENQFLSCPPSIAKDLEPQLQELMGYTMGNYALGYYSDPERVLAADLLPPEIALGRKPRPGLGDAATIADVELLE